MPVGGSAVVVGVDEAGQSSAALLWAAAEARRRDVVLRIVHAWQPSSPRAQAPPTASGRETIAAADIGAGATADSATGATAGGAHHSAPEGVLGRVTEILERVAPDLVVTVEPVQGPPGPVLVDAASEADLLVVGTADPEGSHRLRYGSVSRHCVAHATCEVVVVPEPDPQAVG
jgi:nucleotide-binding universal stress UspA family protein